MWHGPAASQLRESPCYPWRHDLGNWSACHPLFPHLKKRAWVRLSVSRVFSIRPYVWWFCVGKLKHQVWFNILKDGFSSKFVLKFCSWVFLKGTLTWPRGASGPEPGGEDGLPRVQLAAGLHVCFPPVLRVLLSCWSGFPFFHCATFFLFLSPFLFMQISLFASLLPRPLHQAGCSTSLRSAVCLSSSWPCSLS